MGVVRVLLFIAVLLPAELCAQVWDFTEIKKLPANVNTAFEEAAPLLSSDGKTLYFARLLYPKNEGGKYAGADIWVSTSDDHITWSEAVPFVHNNRKNNVVVGVHRDGNSLYLLSASSNEKYPGLYVTRKSNGKWERPESIPIEGIKPQGFLGFYVSPDFEVMFISMKAENSRGQEDIYFSARDASGKWSAPKNVGSAVNTKGFEISPFLSADKKRLYFSSNGHRGFGDADIYYCDRLYNTWDTWSAPRNLGEKVNSKGFDAYFSIYGDSIAFFCSNKGEKFADIYQAKVVPGSEVLAMGQEYLTSNEIATMLGANVSRRITFEGDATELTAPQKELIFFIANKLSSQRNINIHISVVDENDPALTSKRIDAVAAQLRESGIENLRLLLTNTGLKPQNTSRTTLEILLYK